MLNLNKYIDQKLFILKNFGEQGNRDGACGLRPTQIENGKGQLK